MSIKTSPLTITELKKEFGVTRPMVRSVIYNRFNIPADYRICLQYYKVRMMTGKQFSSFMTNEGELRNPDPALALNTSVDADTPVPRFTVIYQDCFPSAVKRAQFITISFRIAHSSFNIEPVAIVRVGKIS